MKAVIKATSQAGSLKIAEVKEPEPGPDEVLVRVRAAGLCNSDVSILNNRYSGRSPVPVPLIMGHEGAGEITGLGEGVTEYCEGDRVALEAISGCGHCSQCKSGFKNLCKDWSHIGITGSGVFAEYIAVPATQVHRISDNISFKEAALLEPLGLVVRSLEQSRPMIGDMVAILGPGSLGILHALAYRAAGAGKVIIIGTGKDKKRLEVARNLGADHTINIDEEDYLKEILNITGGQGADIVVETANSPKATEMAFDLAASRGRIVLFGLYPEARFDQVKLLRKKLTVYGDVGQVSRQFMQAIRWLETGKVKVDGIITRTFSLDEAEEAFKASRECDLIKIVFEI
jgi:2-desacetyl-2-hydroxyethyl bacteriochlorophyllide A dehydrogenase